MPPFNFSSLPTNMQKEVLNRVNVGNRARVRTVNTSMRNLVDREAPIPAATSALLRRTLNTNSAKVKRFIAQTTNLLQRRSVNAYIKIQALFDSVTAHMNLNQLKQMTKALMLSYAMASMMYRQRTRRTLENNISTLVQSMIRGRNNASRLNRQQ